MALGEAQLSVQTHKTGMGEAHLVRQSELRLRSQLRVPFWPQAGDLCTHKQDPGKNELCSTALFWPRLEPLGWLFFESRRAAGAKNRLPQAVCCENR
jgi:hypothetical protein